MRRRAFTLVELLVVIAVLAALFGLLLPTARTGREAAAQATRAHNHRPMARAVRNLESAGGVPTGVAQAVTAGGYAVTAPPR